MALTGWQKQELDEIIRNHFAELVAIDRFTLATLRDYMEDLDFMINPTSLKCALDRVVGHQHDYILQSHDTKPMSYTLMEERWKLTGEIAKEKNILRFVNEKAQYGDLTYNFITHEWSAPINQVLRTIGYNYIGRMIENYHTYMKYEWMYNYTSNLNQIYEIYNRMDEEDIQTCPNGYIKYLQETENEFGYTSLKEYIAHQKYGAVGCNLIKTGMNDEYIKWLIEKDLFKPFMKCLVNNTKSGYLFDRGSIHNLISTWERANAVANRIVPLEENKSIEVNTEMFQNIIDKEKNEALARQLQKLNFINGLRRNNLVVVVPQNQEEKKDEGKQQHNCVGYYYDDSIIDGRNYIYFIRKAETPHKSYVTCRYSTNYGQTAEFRGFSNKDIHDHEVIAFIKSIDGIIKEHLQ